MSGVVPLFKGSAESSAGELFLAYISDDASFQVARAVAGELGWAAATVQRGGAGDALDLFTGTVPLPGILLVDLDGTANPVVTMARLASMGGADSRVVGLGTPNDIDLYRDLMAAGAADYLVKPLTPEALHQIIRSAKQTPKRAPAPEVTPARLIVVAGVRGGLGASTVAVNTAWLIGHELKLKTALLDLDLQFGTDTLALDLEPGRGLREALETPNRLDSLLVKSSLVNESDWLSVMGAEEPLEDGVSFGPTALSALLEELRSGFQVVVVDLPRHLLPVHRPVLGSADQVILVSDFSLAGIRDTVRLMSSIKVLGGPACHVVAGGPRSPQVDRATFERGIQGTIAQVIPQDDKVMATAANQGKAVAGMAPQAASVKAMRALAMVMADAQPPARKSFDPMSWFKKGKV
ncbi:AAA family ATPase [Azospirillum sp. sgz302134]